ncbi:MULTISPECIES: site-2 protease family protein [unclassified Sedimentibacter]|uniref:site-2 protease family protein n=1 Tax=unclassified Sedimentibacter TaxID=2649220 RepID=UPI0027DF9A3E|nr:site-2 protease family protein [Sedimentibacter sp. MB35-C1]WMJ77928.1 site-2 protease family protein [Sedimentibacter sp. MB35-C1]
MNYLLTKLLILPGILLGISIHEFSHGYAAVLMGDDTPITQGRLTLNPIKHIDPLGFLCLLLFGFGWAKPVMINRRNFKDPRRDDALVALAGPAANLLVAFLFVGLMKVTDMFMPYTVTTQILWEILRSTVSINLVLMAFNLIPIPPLDGHHILGSIGGARVWNFYYKYYDQLRFAMLLLIIFRGIGFVIGPVINFMYSFLISIFF